MVKNDMVVNRDSIYAGKVINLKEIAGTINERKTRQNEITPSISTEKELYATYVYDYRSIMFFPDERNLAVDLLYNSNSYPVLNMTNQNICMASDILIADSVWLGPLLERLGFDELMSQKDIKKARKIIFSKNFVSKNCKMFGYEKLSPKQAKTPRRIYELRINIGDFTYRFNPLMYDALPGGYMHFLELLNDNNFKENLERMTCTDRLKLDAFKPPLEEMKATKKYIKKRRNYEDF